ncbi:MAG: helicase C-terminal domain-containing protein [Candidatus Hadarchaeota archaeon]
MELRLYEKGGPLKPRRYSSGKTQTDLIGEIVDAFDESDVVFLKATVGSGKSVVGVRTALELGRGIVSVPTKVLSDQYAASYEGEKYFMKKKGGKAKIGILKGRRNFSCFYAKDKKKRATCAAVGLPCTRPLNKEEGEHRADAVRECPHWGFIFHKALAQSIKGAKKSPYEGVAEEWVWCMKGECPYWKQFEAYLKSDVIVMNSMKWAAEVAVGRLPKVPLTVVDEADDWLDSLALKVQVTEKRIAEIRRKLDDEELSDELDKVWAGTLVGRKDPLDLALYLSALLEDIEEAGGDILWKLKSVLDHWDSAECEVRENSVLYLVPDPRTVLQKFMEKVGGKWLLMSATVQSREILKGVFGIEPVFLEGETKFPGTLIHRATGREEAVNYRRWMNDSFREGYWNLLSEIMKKAKRPGFIPIHAFKYLPPELSKMAASSEAEVFEHDGIMMTTKMDRGADLKGMGSIIITKFPYPEREDPLLKGMEKRLGGEAFWSYYRDIAERCFIQQLGRVVRSEKDRAEFWSPDRICHEMLMKVWKGKVQRDNACFQ